MQKALLGLLLGLALLTTAHADHIYTTRLVLLSGGRFIQAPASRLFERLRTGCKAFAPQDEVASCVETVENAASIAAAIIAEKRAEDVYILFEDVALATVVRKAIVRNSEKLRHRIMSLLWSYPKIDIFLNRNPYRPVRYWDC